MKILIGYDGSQCADLALEDLKRAGLPDVAIVDIASIAEIWLPNTGLPEADVPIPEAIRSFRSQIMRSRERARLAMEEALANARHAKSVVEQSFPGWEVRAGAFGATPAWGLVEKAHEWQPDLVVVGSHGKTGWQRLVLGSVSQTVLTHVDCSVRIARGGSKTTTDPVRLLIGVDGSQGADAAVLSVASRKWPPDTHVKVMAVTDPWMSTASISHLPGVAEWVREGYAHVVEWMNRVVEESAKRLRDAATSSSVETAVLSGDPKRELVEEAERWNADCIFLGARGLTTMQRVFLGSISTAVSQRAHCSVEVVRLKEV
jgi:nucleotide-binding universal stress UspA family protein